MRPNEEKEPMTQEAEVPQRQPESAKPAKSRKRLLILLIILAVLLVASITGVVVWQMTRDQGYERYAFDTDAMAGRIQRMTEEEIQAELNRVVEEGMFNISIASTVLFKSPDSEGEARIENVAANRYHMQVDIILDETGETLYSSKLIRPGYSIPTIRLNRRLEPGEYAATAVFSAITQEEMQLFGQAAAQIKLYVLSDRPTPTPSPSPSPSPQPGQ